MKVLVLDDDESLNQTLCQILASWNIEADGSCSAMEALEWTKAKDYDLILLDYAMPREDGIWFMNHARIPRSTKVLLITGHLERNLINTMFNLGACGYLIKPFDEADLVRNLNFFLPGSVNAVSDNTPVEP